ncbi:Acylpyruvase FAHD1, mitochondrial-like [Aphelenchoides fujianensis]|nr:Acylpyruvase FAHD1, mitochondrial-like [Aphelenchoides fujianensis]
MSAEQSDAIVELREVKENVQQIVGVLNNFPSFDTAANVEPPPSDGDRLILFRKETKNLVTADEGHIKVLEGHAGLVAEIHLGVVVGEHVEGGENRVDEIVKRVAGYVLTYTFRFRDHKYETSGRVFAETTEFPSDVAIGPLIPPQLLERPDGCVIWSKVNGDEVQRAPLSDLRCAVLQMIPHVNQFTALNKGDVVLSGTPAGGFYVRPGAHLECGIEGIARAEFIVESIAEHVPLVNDPAIPASTAE